MARNTLSDLNDHLFMALERLNEENITEKQIDAESKKAKAITAISGQIIKNANLCLNAVKLIGKGDIDFDELPNNFGLKKLKEGSSNGG
jgi:hypothetical protein